MPHAHRSSAAPPSDAAGLRVVTGNRLRDGIPVYFAGDGRWSSDVAEAHAVDAAAGEALLAEAQAGPPPHPVVGAYLIAAELVEGRLRPVGLREEIRAFGPTVRPIPA
jgi:hypothetical protein